MKIIFISTGASNRADGITGGADDGTTDSCEHSTPLLAFDQSDQSDQSVHTPVPTMSTEHVCMAEICWTIVRKPRPSFDSGTTSVCV